MIQNVIEKDDTKFLSHGSVDIINIDHHSRKVIFDITIPYILLFQSMAAILKCGDVSDLRVADQLSVWQPRICKDDLLADNSSITDPIINKINSNIQNQIKLYMEYFSDMCHIFQNPSIIASMLPSGIYVNIKLTANIDAIPNTLLEMQKCVNVYGVMEFQLALSAGLHKVLTLIDLDV